MSAAEKRQECDCVLSATNDENDVELNGETDERTWRTERWDSTTGACRQETSVTQANQLAGQDRTLKAAMEHRMGTRVPTDARILCWLVEFATYLTNRRDIGSDGKTPLQRLHGRRDNTLILEFGEKILYMLAKPVKGGKWEPRFHPGVFVDAELVIRGSACHRARDGDQDTLGKHQEDPGVGEMGRGTRYLECEPFHGPRTAVSMHLTFRSELRDPQR